MMTRKLISLFLLIGLASTFSFANEISKKDKTKVKYKSSGRIDFESLLIEGERKKPEMSVVTGNLGEKDSGLLKFRKNFLDMMADDFGESVQ